MRKVVITAAAVLTFSIGSEFAAQGTDATPTQYTGYVSANNAVKRVWYYSQDPEQYAHPPHYTGPPPTTHTNKVWYYSEDPEQYAHPPHYTGPPPTNHANNVWYYSEDPEQYAHPAH
jgi:hypothetical protein